MNNLKKLARRSGGFTLIELLVVIAVLGVLAAVVIVAINPLQQLAKSRDTGRLNSVVQIGNALVTWATSNNSTYPTTTQWSAASPTNNVLVLSGEVPAIPGAVTGGTACATDVTNSTWCYKVAAASGTQPAGAVVYARLEAKTNTAKCTGLNMFPYATYSTIDGRGGIVCATTAEPTVPLTSAGKSVCATTPCTVANQWLP